MFKRDSRFRFAIESKKLKEYFEETDCLIGGKDINKNKK